MTDVCCRLGLLLALLVLVPSTAAAHSTWVETNPASGDRLKTLPAEATVTVSEEPQQANAVLARPDGSVDTLKVQIVGSVITVQLPAHGPRGEYTLSYRVVAADGHPVSGSTTFTVTTGPDVTAPTPTPTPTPSASASGRSVDQPARSLGLVGLGVAVLAIGAVTLAARSRRR